MSPTEFNKLVDARSDILRQLNELTDTEESVRERLSALIETPNDASRALEVFRARDKLRHLRQRIGDARAKLISVEGEIEKAKFYGCD